MDSRTKYCRVRSGEMCSTSLLLSFSSAITNLSLESGCMEKRDLEGDLEDCGEDFADTSATARWSEGLVGLLLGDKSNGWFLFRRFRTEDVSTCACSAGSEEDCVSE